MTRFQIGSGKSDSFFFNTANNQFIIKTLKEDECKLLVRKGILEKYYQHIKRNPRSLLARFYGIYSVKIKFMKPISVVIMDNLMGQHIEDVISIYDLKGSTHKRRTVNIKNSRTVKKDLNFLLEPQYYMQVNEKQKRDLLQRIAKDKDFLKSCNLMDYSLLMIFLRKKDQLDLEAQANRKLSFYIKREANGDEIEMEEVPDHLLDPTPSHRRPTPTASNNFYHLLCEAEDQDAHPLANQRSSIFENLRASLKADGKEDASHNQEGGSNSSQNRASFFNPRINEFIEVRNNQNESFYYRLGIIDFLQAYTKRKQMETFSLRYRYKHKPQNCFSCVPPDTYGERFYNFLAKNLFI